MPLPFELPGDQADGDARSGRLNVILATTGSVASVKAPLIVAELLKVIATEHSLHFYDPQAIAKDSDGRVRVWRDADEWIDREKVTDPILHVELRRWADLVLVAPLDANTLAKIAGGLCDNLLTSMLRAIDPKQTQVMLFPAMNTQMYLHPLTSEHLAVAKRLGYEVYGPISKGLACGDSGIGAMTEWTDIVSLVRSFVSS